MECIEAQIEKKGTRIRRFINEYILECLFRYQNKENIKENIFEAALALLVATNEEL